jgi:UDP-N-acetylmuramate: L-alanyl-gamma-D-glutamyl-meso-diaminopimelate ligase
VEIARAHCAARVATYEANDARPQSDYSAYGRRSGVHGIRFRIAGPDGESAEALLPMAGRHNVENAVGVYAAARALGAAPDTIVKAFATFLGVKRRQELRGEPGGVLVIDDFAHHPTAVRETIAGVRARYKGLRLWAVFEPRSNTSRRNTYQTEYETAFDEADVITIREPEPHDKVPADQQLDVGAIVRAATRRGIQANALADVAAIRELIVREAKRGDVILVMSNGAFGGLIPALLEALEGVTRA